MIVTGLDLSLTATGVARVEWQAPGDFTVATRVYGSKPAGDALTDRADRLTDLAGAVTNACRGSQLIVVERPAFSSNTGSATDRAGLWWMIVARLIRGAQIPVVDVVNNHLKMYATGKGNAGKDAVLAETVRRYQDHVPNLGGNDEADALVLAAMGTHYVTGHPLVDLPQTHHRALTAVKWSTNIRRMNA